MDTLGISFGEKDAEYVAKSFCQNAEGRRSPVLANTIYCIIAALFSLLF